jgi:ABC-type multidrug transport system fused ATPase/permease subunit
VSSLPAGPAPDPAIEKPTAPDAQRLSLEQLVKLSADCAAEEQAMEQDHAMRLEQENARHQQQLWVDQQRSERRGKELQGRLEARRDSTRNKYEQELATITATARQLRKQIDDRKEAGESELRKQMEQAKWLAESVLEAIETRADAEDRQARQDHETRQVEVQAIENAARQAMVSFEMTAFPVEPAPDDATRAKLAEDAGAVYTAQRDLAAELADSLRKLSLPKFMASTLPYVLILVVAAVLAAVAWLVPEEAAAKFWAAGGAGVVAIGLGAAWFVYMRSQGQAEVQRIYGPLMQALAIARVAATADLQQTSAARETRVKEAREKCAREVDGARDRAKPLQRQALDQHKATLKEAGARHEQQMKAVEDWLKRRTEELAQQHAKAEAALRSEEENSRQQELEKHQQTRASIEADYAARSAALSAKWSEGLEAVQRLLSAGSGIDPQFIDWNSPAWQQWKSPTSFSGQIRFGEMKVDLAQLTTVVPQELKLPAAFPVPALLSFPTQASVLVEADHAGRLQMIEAAQMLMARLLTQMPAGRIKFTLIDPVGLGQSFAGFMHLADHDESLVGSRIWTEAEHIEQRLTDLTEHMETVIQKYLRNEYETIDQYNEQAGELAEPIRFLVVADFPVGFEQEALRRLASIATTGPRCGVYTILLRDLRHTLPAGARMEELNARSVRLVHKSGAFAWDDAVFKRFPLRLDPAPDEKVLTQLMDQVGRAAKEAKRVEVPFSSIAPATTDFWTRSSKSDLRVPIGKSGATRLQSLRFGVGVAQHALIAGKTGSGKSNLMHTIVTNLAMWYSPEEVEFYLVDFKKGVEFKAYATSELPHARAIAVESDREFGLSVLQRVDAELTRRGELFRAAGAQEIGAYRSNTKEKLPRTVLLIDEFQEFFSEDDKLSQEAAVLLDRLVRQGRAFGIHVVLGSQTIGGSAGLARSTLGQMAVRVALQCSEADSQLILGDNNSAARLLTRPGEAIYNDAGGLVEANSPFQIAWLPDDGREVYLRQVQQLSKQRAHWSPPPIVFEGNSPAAIRKNHRLTELLDRPAYGADTTTISAWLGEPVAIKEPTAAIFRPQSGANLLMVGQQEQSAIAIFASMLESFALQHRPSAARFYLLEGTPADSPCAGVLESVAAALPHQVTRVAYREVGDALNEIAQELARRQTESTSHQAIYLMVVGLQRYRILRKQEDDFSFSRSDEEAAPKPDKQFAELLSEGPSLGIHSIVWADTPISIERTLDRGSLRQFDYRVLFQMSAADSSNLIDSPLANKLGAHRALLYSEENGTFEKFRPYQLPDPQWIEKLAALRTRR